jgi:hypothetical protein
MHHGSCLCGSIKYSIDDKLELVVNCHCRFCRKAHGAPFTTLSLMPFNKFAGGKGVTREFRGQNAKLVAIVLFQLWNASVQPFAVERND